MLIPPPQRGRHSSSLRTPAFILVLTDGGSDRPDPPGDRLSISITRPVSVGNRSTVGGGRRSPRLLAPPADLPHIQLKTEATWRMRPELVCRRLRPVRLEVATELERRIAEDTIAVGLSRTRIAKPCARHRCVREHAERGRERSVAGPMEVDAPGESTEVLDALRIEPPIALRARWAESHQPDDDGGAGRRGGDDRNHVAPIQSGHDRASRSSARVPERMPSRE